MVEGNFRLKIHPNTRRNRFYSSKHRETTRNTVPKICGTSGHNARSQTSDGEKINNDIIPRPSPEESDLKDSDFRFKINYFRDSFLIVEFLRFEIRFGSRFHELSHALNISQRTLHNEDFYWARMSSETLNWEYKPATTVPQTPHTNTDISPDQFCSLPEKKLKNRTSKTK